MGQVLVSLSSSMSLYACIKFATSHSNSNIRRPSSAPCDFSIVMEADRSLSLFDCSSWEARLDDYLRKGGAVCKCTSPCRWRLPTGCICTKCLLCAYQPSSRNTLNYLLCACASTCYRTMLRAPVRLKLLSVINYACMNKRRIWQGRSCIGGCRESCTTPNSAFAGSAQSVRRPRDL